MEKDPNYPIPNGFTKVKHIEYQPKYDLPPSLELNESANISIQILDDLVSTLFGFHFLEPTSHQVEKYTVRPILKELVTSKIVKSEIPYKLSSQ